MILGFLIAHKKYNFKKVIFVISIIISVIIFNYNQKKDSKKTESDNLLWGNLMIAASLLFDGLLGATEDKMRAISKPSALNFMYYLNLWSIGFGLLGVLAFNEAPKFIDFTTRHPEIIKYFPLAILIGAIGQLFISSMLSNFGPLPLSLTTTVRKFFSVILSVIVHNNSLQWQQWGAAAIIFGALFTDAIMNKKKANSSSNDNEVVKNNIETVNELEKLDKNETKVVEINGELSKNEILKIT
jgi:solute carrier family 35 (UDP-galactose transporter), member B1